MPDAGFQRDAERCGVNFLSVPEFPEFQNPVPHRPEDRMWQDSEHELLVEGVSLHGDVSRTLHRRGDSCL
jgi:hypothetical protein